MASAKKKVDPLVAAARELSALQANSRPSDKNEGPKKSPIPKAEVLPTICEAKILLAGQEIYYIEFTANFSRNAPSKLDVSVEPSPLIELFLPGTPVHVFVRNPHVEEGNTYKHSNYYLLFEGRYRGRSRSRTGQSESYTLHCHGTQQDIATSSPMAIQMQNMGYLPIMGGSMPATKGILKAQMNIFGAKLYDSKNMTQGFNNYLYTLTSRWSLVNLLFLMKIRFFHNVSALDNRFLKEIVKAGVLDDFLGKNSDISGDQSLLGVIQAMLQKTFYTLSQTPFPTNAIQDTTDRDMDIVDMSKSGSQRELGELYSDKNDLRRERNEHLLLPDLFLSVVPNCNLIHKKCIRSIDDHLDHYNRPTRKIIRSGMFNTGIVVTSPNRLLSATNRLTSDETAPQIKGKMYDTAYTQVSKSEKLTELEKSLVVELGKVEYKLYGPSRPIELLKGITPSMGSSITDEVVAFVSGTSKHSDEKPEGLTAERKKKEDVKYSFYVLLQELAEFTRVKEANAMSVSVSLDSQFWVTPGFPALICDDTSQIYGVVDSVAVNMHRSGSHTIGVTLSNCFNILPEYPKDSFYDELWDSDSKLSINWNELFYSPDSASKKYAELGLGTPNSDLLKFMTRTYDKDNLFRFYRGLAKYVNEQNVNVFLKTVNKKQGLMAMTDIFDTIEDSDYKVSSCQGNKGIDYYQWLITPDMKNSLKQLIRTYCTEVFKDYYEIYDRMVDISSTYTSEVSQRRTKVYGD